MVLIHDPQFPTAVWEPVLQARTSHPAGAPGPGRGGPGADGGGLPESALFAYDRATPYGPVRGILRQLCGITDTDGPEVLTTRLRYCLREAGLTPEAAAPYLLPLLGLPEDATPLAELSPEARVAAGAGVRPG